MDHQFELSDLDKQLLRAAREGDIDSLQILISQDANINVRDKFGRTPIMLALDKGHIEAGIYLFDMGADISVRDPFGNTAITLMLGFSAYKYIGKGYEDMRIRFFDRLLARKVDFNHIDDFGRGILRKAIDNGNLHLGIYFIENGVHVTQEDRRFLKQTIISYLQIVDAKKNGIVLSEKQEDLMSSYHDRDSLGRTPLMLALKQNDMKIAKFLVDSGAEVFVEDYSNASVYKYLAATYKNIKKNDGFTTGGYYRDVMGILRKIMQQDKGFEKDQAVQIAFDAKNFPLLDILVLKGGKGPKEQLNNYLEALTREEKGSTMIQFAKSLIKKGADVQVIDKQGRSLLMLCLEKGDLEGARFYIQKNINLFAVDAQNESMFTYLGKLSIEQKPLYTYQLKMFMNAMLKKLSADEKTNALVKIAKTAIEHQRWNIVDECVERGLLNKKTLQENKDLIQILKESQRPNIREKIVDLELKENRKLLEQNFRKSGRWTSASWSDGINTKDQMTETMQTFVDIFIQLEKQEIKMEQDFLKQMKRESYHDKQQFAENFRQSMEKVRFKKMNLKNTLNNMFANGAQIDFIGQDGKTPLNRCIQEGAFECAEHLIHNGANVHAADRWRLSPIDYLVTCALTADTMENSMCSKKEYWRSLLDVFKYKEVNLKGVDAYGMSLIEKALRTQNFSIAEKLVLDGAFLPKEEIQDKFFDIVKHDKASTLYSILHLRGVPKPELDEEGKNLLMVALEHGSVANVKKLLLDENQWTAVNKDGNSIVHLLAQCAHNAQNIPKNLPETHYDYARRENHDLFTKILHEAIGKGISVNSKNAIGRTPIMEAVNKGKFELANLMVDFGATAEYTDEFGNHIMHLCAKQEKPKNMYENRAYNQFLDWLMKQPLNFYQKNYAGKIPLDYANVSSHHAVSQKLLMFTFSRDFEPMNVNGATPLMLTAQDGTPEKVQLYLDKGCKINKQDNHGKTALHYAVESDNQAALKKLCENQADINVRDLTGKTPLDLAVNASLFDLAYILIDHSMKKKCTLEVQECTIENLTAFYTTNQKEMTMEKQAIYRDFMWHQRNGQQKSFYSLNKPTRRNLMNNHLMNNHTKNNHFNHSNPRHSNPMKRNPMDKRSTDETKSFLKPLGGFRGGRISRVL